MKMSNNSTKYEALIKQYLRSILNVGVKIASVDSQMAERYYHPRESKI